MWINQLRRKLQAGDVTFVAQITEFPSADVAEYLALLGFDGVLIDCEHSGVDPLRCREMCRATVAAGATPLVRVPYNDPNVILAYLDAGAHGIIVPHSRTAADVRASVEACRYPPDGVRGAAASSRGSSYGIGMSPVETFAQANREVMVIPLLEDIDAIENLTEILQVDGVDLVFIGPGDLAMSMGKNYGDPEVRAVADEAVKRVNDAGLLAATPATTAEQAQELITLGVKVITTQPFGLFRDVAETWLSVARS